MNRNDEISAQEHNRTIEALMNQIRKVRRLTEAEQFVLDHPANYPIAAWIHETLAQDLMKHLPLVIPFGTQAVA